MKYLVSAKFANREAAEFLRRLTDGSIERQKPDGKEIVASMRRARVDPEGRVHWREECYCSPPLDHERKTVYDAYFTDFRTRESEGEGGEIDGEPFMEFLARSARETPSKH